MSSLSHPQTCRCSLHAELAARRHECYRQLAKAILGPAAPEEDLALARALGEHAAWLSVTRNISPIRRERAA